MPRCSDIAFTNWRADCWDVLAVKRARLQGLAQAGRLTLQVLEHDFVRASRLPIKPLGGYQKQRQGKED